MAIIKVDYGDIGGGVSGAYVKKSGTASASSYLSNYPPSNATNNSTWYYSSTGIQVGQWIQCDFQQSTKINSVCFNGNSSNVFPTSFVWELSYLKNGNYIPIEEYDIGTSSAETPVGLIAIFDEIETTAIRLTLKSGSGGSGNLGLSNFRLFGSNT